MTTLALNSDQIGKLGIGIIVALVVLGLLLSLIVTAIVGRIVIALVVVVLALVTWQQRSSIQDKINKHDCKLSASFFGFTVNAPDDVVRACNQQLKK
jgi:small-conductance mechanosensitive channel